MGEQVQGAINLVERVLKKVNEFDYKSFPEFVIALESNKFTIARKVATEEEKQLQNLQNKLEEHLGSDWKEKSAEKLIEDFKARYEELTEEEHAAIREGLDDIRAGRVYTSEEIEKELLG